MGPYPRKYCFREIDTGSIATICGGILFHLVRYNKREIWEEHFRQISSYLYLDERSLYGVDVSINGFVLFTRSLTMKYVHSEDHSQRIVQLLFRAY